MAESAVRILEQGAIPTRFHIGLQRAASTYIYDLLASHPDAALPRKGLGFYANKYDRGLAWYSRQFPVHGVPIDPSPVYFVRGQDAAPRIRETLAGATPRFLLVLRNPIDYTASRFLLHRRINRFQKRLGWTPPDLRTLLARDPAYLDGSRFAQILERWWLPLFDRKCFHIVLFEQFTHDRESVAAQLLEFFGLRPRPLTAVPSSRNATLRHPILHTVKSAIVARPRLHAALRGNAVIQRLYDRFLVGRGPALGRAEREWLGGLLAPDVARLKALLGDPLATWTDFR